MLSSILPSSASISVSLVQTVIFLHPPPSYDTDAPSSDPILRGSVTLDLPKPRIIRNIVVTAKGQVDIGYPNRAWESHVVLNKELELSGAGSPQLNCKGKEKEMVLEKGTHTFEFSFIIPSSLPPFERSIFGRTLYKVIAVAKSSGIAPNLQAHQFFELIVNPTKPSELPEGFDLVIQDYADDFGIVTIRHSSPNLTVSGLVLLEISFLEPPRKLLLYTIETYLVQRFSLYSVKNGSLCSEPPVQKKRLLIVGHDVPDLDGCLDLELKDRVIELEAGKPWKLKRWLRIPNDNAMRPSTHPSSNTPIKIKHTLVTEVSYTTLGQNDVKTGPRRIISSSKDVFVTSCCCMLDSVTLPAYSPPDPSPPLPLPGLTNTLFPLAPSRTAPEGPVSTKGTKRSKSAGSLGSKRRSLVIPSSTTMPSPPSSTACRGALRGLPPQLTCVCGQQLETLLDSQARLLETTSTVSAERRPKWQSQTS